MTDREQILTLVRSNGHAKPPSRRDARRAAQRAVTPEDVTAVVRGLVIMAKSGDVEAARLVLRLALGRERPPPRLDPAREARLKMARAIAQAGPLSAKRLEKLAGLDGVAADLDAAELLEGCPWFEREGDGWHLTGEGLRAARGEGRAR